MGNFSTKDLRDLFDDVPHVSGECSTPRPSTAVLLDPRSPLPNAVRTPIEIIKEKHGDYTEDVLLNVTRDHKSRVQKQLGDPRSISKGIVRTPILVESSPSVSDALEVQRPSDTRHVPDTENEVVHSDDDVDRSLKDETPTRVSEGPQKAVVPKKLSFDSPKLGEVVTRSPLGHVSPNSPERRGRRRHSQCREVRPATLVSPAQLIHVKQRRAVKKALQEAGAPTRSEQALRI